MTFFGKVSLAQPDPIFGLTSAFLADSRASKVNLGAGIYKDENLQTPVLHAVKQAEATLLQKEKSKEYLPIEGDQVFIDQIGQLVFGSDVWAKESKRCCGFQTPGGTGALRIAGAFLKKEADVPLFLPDPTWPNHKGVFAAAGFNVGAYPYYDFEHHCLGMEKLLSFCKQIPSQSIIVFHASCHNPTGADPSIEQWEALATLCQERRLLPFFDCAYQGFGRGIDQDAEAVRLFAAKQVEMVVAVSQSKNFSLYGERVGALYFFAQTPMAADHVKSRVKQVIRTHYSNPPAHGAKIVGMILQDRALRASWLQELDLMRMRINTAREQLAQALSHKLHSVRLSYMKQGNGMFCFTGLNKAQVEMMVKDFGIYMTSDGRINICGLNSKNVDYVASGLFVAMQHHRNM